MRVIYMVRPWVQRFDLLPVLIAVVCNNLICEDLCATSRHLGQRHYLWDALTCQRSSYPICGTHVFVWYRIVTGLGSSTYNVVCRHYPESDQRQYHWYRSGSTLAWCRPILQATIWNCWHRFQRMVSCLTHLQSFKWCWKITLYHTYINFYHGKVYIRPYV